jgi:Ca2+-transporting ATPase
MDSNRWHNRTIDETLSSLDVATETGLAPDEIQNRREKYGSNELVERGLKSPWKILLEQFRETMVIVLIVAAVISAVIGDVKDMIAILAIVILNAVLGFVQEYRAEQAMAALKKMSAPVVKVRRGGHVLEIKSVELVPGDVILLEVGDAIPADSRLITATNLKVQEASLTGESIPVEKATEPVEGGEEIALGDRSNMVYLGTAVTYGRGSAVVVGTGMRTELGKIADMIQTVESEQTPLQRRMAQLGKTLALAAIGIVAIVFVLGMLRGEDLGEMFLTAVAMAVAAIPEGLPAVVTISLALGAQRMLRRNALIRKLPAVETLGSVTVICSDKTGTLTENRMTVTVLDVLGETEKLETLMEGGFPIIDVEVSKDVAPPVRSLGLMVKAAALCNDAILEPDEDRDGDMRVIGDPTEGALVAAAAKLGLWKQELDKRWPRVAEAPFTSERKRMTTVHRVNIPVDDPTDVPWREAPYVAFCKGSVDGLLEISNRVWSGDEEVELQADLCQRIQKANDELALDGQRVLGVAFRPLSSLPENGEIEANLEKEMTFVGLVAMLDPPRPEVKQAVREAREAGIRPLMITGDHPLTARRIAQDLGIIDEKGQVLTGKDLATMGPNDLDKVVENVSVFARVAPEHKLWIVEALQKKGHIVAMTGDGVNDAPALRRSDIGVAMGITGTDVSKEASDMVILDDNFATIVNAVKEGRNIYDNVRKFIKYTMTSNAGEIYVMLFAPFLGMPLPLTALQILWINLVTDGLPGLALAVEQPERSIMKRPPYPPNESIFARGMGAHIIWVGLLMGLLSLGVGYWGWSIELPAWQTILFTTLTISQMAHASVIRSSRDSILTIGLFSNPFMIAAVSLTFVLQMLVVYWAPLQNIFGTQALSMWELGLALGLSLVVFAAVEIEKWFQRRRPQGRLLSNGEQAG